jgi:calcineurin-like phosphoesterase family protein
MHLCHKPEDYNPKYQVNLVGHVHEKWKVKWIDNTLLINVGVDVWDFRPVSFERLYALIEKELRLKLQ